MTVTYVGDPELDKTGVVTQCNKDGKRTKSYSWRLPVLCDTETGVKLKPDEIIPCRGCTKGLHRDPETDKCVYCDVGEY